MIEVIAITLVLILGVACVWRIWDEHQDEKKEGGKMP